MLYTAEEKYFLEGPGDTAAHLLKPEKDVSLSYFKLHAVLFCAALCGLFA